MLVVPGGAYRYASPSEGDVVARWFYKAGYNVFVLAYTVNYLDEPLDRVPLNDISRAVRIIRKHAEACSIDPDQIVVCGFSAGGHLCASLCVHYKDVKDCRPEYDEVSNRPDAAILAYPVITSKGYEDSESFRALLGEKPDAEELKYMTLEDYVTEDTPPCFIWQTAPDATVPVEHSCIFADACRKAGVKYAHHVFSDGVHGMSIANEDWLEEKNRDPVYSGTACETRFCNPGRKDKVSCGKRRRDTGRARDLKAQAGEMDAGSKRTSPPRSR